LVADLEEYVKMLEKRLPKHDAPLER